MPEVAESTTDANGFYDSIRAVTQFKPHRTTREKPSATHLHSISLGYHLKHPVELAVVDSKASYGETAA